MEKGSTSVDAQITFWWQAEVCQGGGSHIDYLLEQSCTLMAGRDQRTWCRDWQKQDTVVTDLVYFSLTVAAGAIPITLAGREPQELPVLSWTGQLFLNYAQQLMDPQSPWTLNFQAPFDHSINRYSFFFFFCSSSSPRRSSPPLRFRKTSPSVPRSAVTRRSLVLPTSLPLSTIPLFTSPIWPVVKPSPVSPEVWRSRPIVMRPPLTPPCWLPRMLPSSARRSVSPPFTSSSVPPVVTAPRPPAPVPSLLSVPWLVPAWRLAVSVSVFYIMSDVHSSFCWTDHILEREKKTSCFLFFFCLYFLNNEILMHLLPL